MTAVEFHTGVADPLDFACRLLRKAYRKGVHVAVTAPAPVLLALDRALWTFDERDFVPHLRLGAGPLPAAAPRTPIWLVDGEVPPAGPEVLVNLGADAPAELARFTRVIEVVAADPEQHQQGRERWRDYKLRGASVVHHAG